MLSDQQVVTGIALLVSGYVQLPCDLDVYHWQILVYLVWFSSMTHLTTLTVLRQHFRDHPAIRSWRAVLMLITVLMLGVALLPTGHALWYPSSYYFAAIPVKCVYQRLAPKYVSLDVGYSETGHLNEWIMITSILILFFGYMTRLIKLSRRATTFTKYWLRSAPGAKLNKLVAKCESEGFTRSKRLHWRLTYWLLTTIYVCLHAYYEIFESMLSEVVLLL